MTLLLPITAIILAGGLSSRMGQDKASLLFNNKPLIRYSIELGQATCREVIISANHPNPVFNDIPFFPDLIQQAGPAAGISSCLRQAGYPDCLIIPVDTPFLPKELPDYLYRQHQPGKITFPADKLGNMLALTGIYPGECYREIDQLLLSGYRKISEITRKIGANPVIIHDGLPFYRNNLFLNINNPEDLQTPIIS
jgi:molybdenum cofactor guanylyltransferase